MVAFARAVLVVTLGLAMAACLADPAVHCADGTVCPADTTCVALAGTTHCVTAAQIASCVGSNPGDPCEVGNDEGGVCSGGACVRRGCGDGFLSPGELCEGTLLGDETCVTRGYHGGTLACADDCTFDESACTGLCGDGIVSDDEDCDPGSELEHIPPDLGGHTCEDAGFYQPSGVTCTDACRLDFAACGGGRCGDGVVNGDEQCEVGQLGGADCTTVGGFYQAAGLACNSACRYDVSACQGRCGDHVRNGPEECDGPSLGAATTCDDIGFYGTGSLACTATCTYDRAACEPTGFCGDGVVNGAEQCDGAALAGATCQSAGGYYDAAGLACNSECRFDFSGCHGRCGDGEINGAETCDPLLGLDPAHDTCGDFGFYNTTAPVTCSPICQYDISACAGRCGDGAINGGEQCDGAALGGATCASYDGGGWYGGAVACDVGCRLDGRACVAAGRCGDGVKNGTEACDASDFGGQSCLTAGLFVDGHPRYQGQLLCRAGCTIDTRLDDAVHGCHDYCGDGAINGPEVCDDHATSDTADDLFVGDATCRSFGYQSGNLICLNQCANLFVACQDRCGDGVVQGDEQCDGATHSALDASCGAVGAHGALACTSFCQRDTRTCEISTWGGVRVSVAGGPAVAQQVYAVWSGRRRDVWLVTGADQPDLVVHGDGTRWAIVPGPGTPTALTGRADGTVWLAAGGQVWERGPTATDWTPVPGGSGAPIITMWADATELYAATATQVWHRVGGVLTAEAIPGPIEQVIAMRGRPGAPPLVAYRRGGATWLAEHVGPSWTASQLPFGFATFDAMWLHGDQVWLVGGNGGPIEIGVRIDNTWSIINPVEETAGGTAPLLGTAVGIGGDLDDLWLAAVDPQGAPYLATTDPDHADRWITTVGAYPRLRGLFEAPTGEMWAFGEGAVMAHRDGPGWRAPVLPGVTTDLTTPRGALAAGEVTSIAIAGADVWFAITGGPSPLVRYRRDQPAARQWTQPLPFFQTRTVIARGANDVWAMPMNGTTAQRWNGSTWATASLPFDASLVTATATIAGDVYVTTDGGLYRYAGTWTTRPAPPQAPVALGGTGPADLWAVGGGGAWHYDGAVWTQAPTTVSDLWAVWAASADDVWLAGVQRTFSTTTPVILHKRLAIDGGGFQIVSRAPVLAGALRAMVGAGPADIWAAGDAGQLVHYDGVRWVPVTPTRGATTADLRVLVGDSQGQVWAGGRAALLTSTVPLPPAAPPPCADAVPLYCAGLDAPPPGESMPMVGTIPVGGAARFLLEPPYRAQVGLNASVSTPTSLSLRVLAADQASGACTTTPLAQTTASGTEIGLPVLFGAPLILGGHAPVYVELSAPGATAPLGFALYPSCTPP